MLAGVAIIEGSMLLSRYFFTTYRKNPAPAEAISHSLMLRSGMIRQLGAGIYTWLPIGVRVIEKMTRIIREEMNAAGAHEVSMPSLQPAELWEKSGRWQDYGAELMRLKDRHQREFCLGPTHEEVVTELAGATLHSYKQLPVNLYQVRTKFRDEIRPRFGVMRGREFTMKDAYSFHRDQKCLQETYDVMRQTYRQIFSRAGLKYCDVVADSGNIGGNTSHEFHALADSGEDAIAVSQSGKYAANIELAEALGGDAAPEGKQEMCKVATGKRSSIEEISEFLKISPMRAIKTLVVEGSKTPAVALLVRGDHQLNPIKAARLPAIASPLKFASKNTLQSLGLNSGTIGPVGIQIPVIADRAVASLSDFCCGAGEIGHHYTGVNWQRDCPKPEVADLRNVQSGDPSPDGEGTLEIKRGIEVGHIFQLGQKYSVAMGLRLQDDSAQTQALWMGCYGIGVERAIAAAIEQNHDERGIIFPQAIAPFQLLIVAADIQQSEPVRDYALDLYARLREANIDVALDDREQRLGVKLGDAELLGIPHCLIVSKRNLEKQQLEYRARSTQEPTFIAMDKAQDALQTLCANP
jgi:prolyl-tRNA synthetase